MFDESRSDARTQRAAGATAATLALHALLVLVIAFLMTRGPGPVRVVESLRPVSTLVYLEMTGPGGGGGGSPEPAPAVPVEIPRTTPPARVLVETPPVVVPPPPPVLDTPIMTPDAASFRAAGTSLIAPAARGGGGRGIGLGPGAGRGVGDGVERGFGGGVPRGGAGIAPPVLVREQEPAYTSEAVRAKIQGQVEVEAIVLEDGSVGDVVVTRSLDRTYGLDLEAVKAARQWRFLPARRDGTPVRIVVRMLLSFRIH